MTEVRSASAADAARIATALARAFHDDPVVAWLWPDARRREVAARRFFELRTRQLLPHEEVYSDGDGVAAALWAPPGRAGVSPRQLLALARATGPTLRARIPRALRWLRAVDAHQPERPHWYLELLGTEPASQGKGIGSAVIAPVLDLCDRDRLPAYLETANERNIAFYARHGFRVQDEFALWRGPRAWLMWREPR